MNRTPVCHKYWEHKKSYWLCDGWMGQKSLVISNIVLYYNCDERQVTACALPISLVSKQMKIASIIVTFIGAKLTKNRWGPSANNRNKPPTHEGNDDVITLYNSELYSPWPICSKSTQQLIAVRYQCWINQMYDSLVMVKLPAKF